ncbi:FUSC family protein [Arthrobacter sp. TB 23]|uniref:FUSC family protein n=1 Tax=Arthrobacter sp. TB 23 TaxID=494419 RepID=UPI00031C2C7B|nr:FUSC family protein [Arthrobacter sp. TB 23]
MLKKPSGARLLTQMGGLVRHRRILLAVKAALAASIAWLIALQVPGVAAEYPYYAPLGAVACMYPTISGSAKQGFQILIGLAIGFALAFPIIFLGDRSVFSIALVVGFGVLAGGLPRIGAGRDWIPIAALFVLLLGGDDPDGYSFGYLVQMLVGVTVGLIVNIVIVPPLHLTGVITGLDDLRSALSLQLKDMGEALREQWPPEHEEWADRQTKLTTFSQEVRTAVQLADSSRHGNIRQYRHKRDLAADFHSLQSMERITFYVEDMTELLADVIWRSPETTPLPKPLGPPLAHALNLTAAAVEEWDTTADSMTDAEAAVEDLMGHVKHVSPDDRIEATASMGMSLRRILLTIHADAGPQDQEGITLPAPETNDQ